MNHRNKISFVNVIQPLENHSLSTECIFKPAENWTYGFQTSCEAYVYYYPYNEARPTKCASKPEDYAVQSGINTYWTTLNNGLATTIGEAAKTLNDENKIFQNSTLGVFDLIRDYGGYWLFSYGRCSYSQLGDTINLNPASLPKLNFSDDMIFDRQECKGVIRAFKTHRFSKIISFIYE